MKLELEQGMSFVTNRNPHLKPQKTQGTLSQIWSLINFFPQKKIHKNEKKEEESQPISTLVH